MTPAPNQPQFSERDGLVYQLGMLDARIDGLNRQMADMNHNKRELLRRIEEIDRAAEEKQP